MQIKPMTNKEKYIAEQEFVSKVNIPDRFIDCSSNIFNKYNINKTDYILDIGCRRGDGIRNILKAGYENAYGTDIGSSMIKGDIYDSHFIQQDMHEEIKFEHMFDFISIIHTLEHSYDYEKVLAVINKKLNHGAIAFIVVPKGELENSAHFFAAENLEDLIPSIESNFNILEQYSTRNNTEFNYVVQKR